MRQRILPALGLLFIASQGFAADSTPTVSDIITVGGLACFTVTPAQAAPKDTTNTKDCNELCWPDCSTRPVACRADNTKNCNELCAAHGAACTGVAVGAMNPPPNCEARYITPEFSSCRCCAVSK